MGVLFGLLAPVLLAAVAFAIDVTAWYRDAVHLQGLADRAAVSAAPLWSRGERAGAVAVARALVADDSARLDFAGAVRQGRWVGTRDAMEVAVSGRKSHVFAVIALGDERQRARAVAMDGGAAPRLVE